jgi:hypothetical protein
VSGVGAPYLRLELTWLSGAVGRSVEPAGEPANEWVTACVARRLSSDRWAADSCQGAVEPLALGDWGSENDLDRRSWR